MVSIFFLSRKRVFEALIVNEGNQYIAILIKVGYTVIKDGFFGREEKVAMIMSAKPATIIDLGLKFLQFVGVLIWAEM